MSEEQEKAAIGEMVESYLKAKNHLAVLKNEAVKIGGNFQYLGQSLVGSDPSVSISTKEHVIVLSRLAGPNMPPNVTKIPLSEIHAEKIVTLIDDLEKTRRKKDELEVKLRQLGLNLLP